MADETNGAVDGIPHDRVIRMTEQLSEAEGYLRHPPGKTFWYNTDYQIYHFFDAYPEYDYVLACEYDCVLNIDVETIVDAMAAGGLAFVGEPIRTAASIWPWTERVRPYYGPELAITGRLLCCAAFSRGFAGALQAARRGHSARALEHGLPVTESGAPAWPNNEAFVGAEIARLSAPEAPFSAFGDVTWYDWAPPYLEAELPQLARGVVVHPVQDASRYLDKLLRMGWNLEDLFRPRAYIHTHLARCDPADRRGHVPGAFHADRQLGGGAQAAAVRRGQARRAGGLDVRPRARQAGDAELHMPMVAARRRRDGRRRRGRRRGDRLVSASTPTRRSGPGGASTSGARPPVAEVRVYNRLDNRARARGLVISCSTDLARWETLYQHDGLTDFGGADGHPLKVVCSAGVPARFIRLSLRGFGMLHLDEVEVYD